MRNNKIGLILILVLIPLAAGYTQQEPATVDFLWAFLCRDSTGEIRVIDPEQSTITLQHRDQVKIFLKPLSQCYLYLFLLDTEGRLALLFPEYIAFFRQGYAAGITYHIPEGEHWFYLDDKSGTEEFYLLAGNRRLDKLERFVLEYNRQRDEGDPEKILEQQRLVQDEIKRLRLEWFRFDSAPGKPVPVAGNYRGVEELVEILASEVEVDDFYAKTIRIKH